MRVDTTGYLAGAAMKEVQRREGLYNVQVADHPVPPEEGPAEVVAFHEETKSA